MRLEVSSNWLLNSENAELENIIKKSITIVRNVGMVLLVLISNRVVGNMRKWV